MRVSPPTTSIVVPTYRRPDQLGRCLAALATLTARPLELIVVHRADDHETMALLESLPLCIRAIPVQDAGVVAAMQAGIAAARGDLVALVDDDAELRPDWLCRVTRHFRDATVGAVCGRDIVTTPDTTDFTCDVGRLSRWGQTVGHHHRMTGAPREVDLLKGANVMFRRSLVQLPLGLRGHGAQVHWEVATCLWLQNAGFRNMIDPQAVALHLPGPRFDSDRRGRPAFGAAFNASYNLVLAVCTPRERLLLRRVLFGAAVGDAACPGLFRGLVAVARRENHVVRLIVPSVLGHLAGGLCFALGRRLRPG